jgi:hypothetical protein
LLTLLLLLHVVTCYNFQIWFQEDFRNFWDACPWEEDLHYAKKVGANLTDATVNMAVNLPNLPQACCVNDGSSMSKQKHLINGFSVNLHSTSAPRYSS